MRGRFVYQGTPLTEISANVPSEAGHLASIEPKSLEPDMEGTLYLESQRGVREDKVVLVRYEDIAGRKGAARIRYRDSLEGFIQER